MAVTTTYKLATKYTKPLSIGGYLFFPGVTYTEKSFPMTKEITNALALGTLTYTDATSLANHQANPILAVDIAADVAVNGGARASGSTATSTTIKLASTYTVQTAIGPYLFKPGVTYSDQKINLTDPWVLSALARGVLIWADSTSAATVIGNPVVYQEVSNAHSQIGYFGPHNAYSV